MPEMLIEEVQSLAYKMMVDDANRNIAFDAYNQMYHSGWDLPREIKNLPWIQKVINSDPYDATQTGIRIISTIPLSLKFQPLAPGPENKKKAGVIEKVCKWQLKSSNKRRSRQIEGEIAKMALLYDMAVVKVVDLEYEIKEKRAVNASTKREENALRQGRFMITPFDSRDVYIQWSNLGLEGVLVAQHRHASQIVQEWGSKATQYEDLMDLAKQTHDNDWVTYYDYWSLETRSTWVQRGRVWAVPPPTTDGKWVLDHGSNPLPFIPFAVRGGTDLEVDPVHRYQPLMYPVYATGAWDIKNIVQTLGVSEIIAHTGAPRYVEEGPNTQQAEVDYNEPERIAKMPPGNILKALAPPAIDNALIQVEAMLSAQLDKEMVSSVLQGGDLPAGTAFATLNLVTQTAIGVLKPAKYLTELVLADVFEKILLWTEFTNKPLYGFDQANEGFELTIEPDELDPNSIYIDVELHPDAPTDRQQKINAASQAVQTLGMSQETALDEIGIEDPSEELKKGIFEALVQHELSLRLDRERMMMEADIQMQVKAMDMQMQMAAQKAMADAAGGEQAGGPTGPPPGPPGEQPGQLPPGAPPGGIPGGEGFNPEAGGQPPAGAAPGLAAEGAGFPAEEGPEEAGVPL